jgi:hypothetical protein
LIIKAPTLKFYNPNMPTIIKADASSYGLGGVILQIDESGKTHPVAFCSRTLTPTEQRYAQIEKECLASTYVCEKFKNYLVGLESFKLITDHKPLVSLINNKDISQSPLRCQRLLLRLMRFNAVAEYNPGKTMYVSDVLSRNPLPSVENVEEKLLHDDIEAIVDFHQLTFPATNTKIDEIRSQTQNDKTLQKVIQHTLNGWPEYTRDMDNCLHPYHSQRDQLFVANGLLLHRDRIVIPKTMQSNILKKYMKVIGELPSVQTLPYNVFGGLA